MAIELYHRIKSGETTFEEASWAYGEGPERIKGGLMPMQSLVHFPLGLAPLLEKLEPGKLSMPLGLGKGYCLVQLEDWQQSQLDKGTQDYLLAEQLRYWIDSVVDELVNVLGSLNKSQPNESL